MIAIWTRGIVATRLRYLALSAGGIIAATALSSGAPLVSRDGKIRASQVQTIW